LRPIRPSVGLIVLTCGSSRNCVTFTGTRWCLAAFDCRESRREHCFNPRPNSPGYCHRRSAPVAGARRGPPPRHYNQREDLTWQRLRRGKGFHYVREDGTVIRDRTTVRRLASLAVPPAYDDVRYAPDPAAHLQAIGRDAAGRSQYRYHSDWQKVRETRKARRLVRLAQVLPSIRRRSPAACEPASRGRRLMRARFESP